MVSSRGFSSDDEAGDSIDSFVMRVAEETDPPGYPSVLLRPNSVLAARFRIDSFARRGGMGAIYRGVDLETDRPIAVKTMDRLAHHSAARFAREVSILAELSHASIVQYLAHGETPEGALYLVMEWLDGEDLAERLNREPLSLEDSFLLLRRVSGALSVAHERGVVHRDIKPANLFLPQREPGKVKILDFGIARFSRNTQVLTTEGIRLGTVGYMSPEQAMGEHDVDARTDVFALGCVFYECITGQAPFASAHPVGVLAKVLQQDPVPPSELKPDLHPAIDEFVGRLLAKKPCDRPLHAGAVFEDFKVIASRSRCPAPKLRRPLSPRRNDQRVVSVILGRQRGGAIKTVDRDDLAVATLCLKFDATITPVKGGALLLVLAGSGEANDRASQAVLCALELSQLQAELVLAVATGLADTSSGVPVGVAIDRAAAVLGDGVMEPGVLLDDVTLGLVGLRFEVRRQQGSNLLIAARRDFGTPRLLMGRSTPHVGRDREMRLLDEALNECVVDRVSRLVIVTGSPGIGKTRLASEWLARGGRGGRVRTLFACANPSSAGSAWALVRQLIRDAADLREAEPVGVQLKRFRDHLAQVLGETAEEWTLELLSEVAGLVNDQQPSSFLLAARSSPEVMREQVRRAIHTWLDAEVTSQPLLLVLEDLHWGDVPSIEFLASALRNNQEQPLMLLALARPEIDRRSPELSERAVLHLRLPGINARAARMLIESALAGGVDDHTCARLLRTSDGNPFYLEELLRRVASGCTDWPDTVVAMVQSRMQGLDPSARCVLLAASVFGERCWNTGISEMVEDDVDVDATLELLVDEEIMMAVDDSRFVGAREYRFRHDLFRDAAHAMMKHGDRCISHGIAGEWLERNREKDPRLLADHYEAAGAFDRARPWLLLAAKKAVNAGDLQVTIELANRGVALGSEQVDCARFLILRFYAQALSGEFDLDVTREVLELLPVGTPLWWLALGVMVFGACTLGKPEAAVPYVSLAVDAPFTREPDLALGQGMLALVAGLVLLGQSGVAEAIVERAKLRRDDGVPDPLFDAFLAAAECGLEAIAPVAGRWRLESALLGARRCVQTLGSLGALHGQSVATTYLAAAALHLGRHEEARDAALLSCQLTRQVKSHDVWPYLYLAKAYVRLNQPREALKAIAPILASPDRTARQMLPIVLGEAHLRLNDPAAAEAAVSGAFRGKSPRLQRLAACVLARALLRQSRSEEAFQTVEAALSAASAPSLESDVELLNLKTECLLVRGECDAARIVVARARNEVFALATQIEDAALRRSFLDQVEPCARALELYGRLS